MQVVISCSSVGKKHGWGGDQSIVIFWVALVLNLPSASLILYSKGLVDKRRKPSLSNPSPMTWILITSNFQYAVLQTKCETVCCLIPHPPMAVYCYTTFGPLLCSSQLLLQIVGARKLVAEACCGWGGREEWNSIKPA